MEKQIEAWQKTAARYDSEPETHEGRKELAERAKEAEENRNTALAKYHAYEIASAAFQIGIVLASAAVITEIIGARLAGGAPRCRRACGDGARHTRAACAAFALSAVPSFRGRAPARSPELIITNHAEDSPALIPLDLWL